MRWICLLGLLAASTTAVAQYRCLENGKIVFTDRPCPTDTPATEQPLRGDAQKIVGDSGNSAYSSPFGTWRGQIQYQTTGADGINQDAMAVVAMTMDMAAAWRTVVASGESPLQVSSRHQWRSMSPLRGVTSAATTDVCSEHCW